MASFFNFGRFRQQAKTPPVPANQQPPASPLNGPPQSPSTLTAPSAPQAPLSPTLSAGTPVDRTNSSDNMQQNSSPAPRQRPPFYFREAYSELTVKGNFMTLATKPEHVEKGEWFAHQVVEQYRLLETLMKVVQEIDQATRQSLCNPQNCPQMTAPNNTVYTWLDNQKNPIRIPASQYMSLVQKWILTKIGDPRLFPTDPNFLPTIQSNSDKDWLGRSSGFPESFHNDIRSLYRQMFRCYAHLYYAHWLEPFYHLNLVKELNTCFIHFVNVGREFDLLAEKDLMPMMPLIQIWTANKLLPAPSSQVQPPSMVQTPNTEQGPREVGAAAA